MLENINCNSQR